jgi:excisionase family DNA binding protein
LEDKRSRIMVSGEVNASGGRGEERKHAGASGGGYVTLSEMARLLGIGQSTAWEIVVVRNEVPYYRFGDRAVRVSRADIEDYVARCRMA